MRAACSVLQRSRARVAAAVRVATTMLVLQFLIGFLAAGAARARAGEVLLGIGVQVAKLADGELRGGTSIVVNGARFEIATGKTPLAPKEAAARIASWCARGGSLAAASEALGAMLQKAGAGVEPAAADRLLTFQAGPRQGIVCLASGELSSWAETAEAAGEFLRTGNLTEVGIPVMGFVEPAEQGGAVLVVAAARGPINVYDMFPSGRDVPGREPAEVPRPPQSQRVLSAYAEGRTAMVSTYRVNGSLERLRHSYLRELRDAGVRPSLATDRAPTDAALTTASTWFVERGGKSLVVWFGVEEGAAWISLVAL